jgi:serine protease
LRRTVTAVLFFLTAASVFAADTQRYIVLTSSPVLREINGRARIQDAENNVFVEPRNVAAFRNIGGFAADLTADEVRALRRTRGVREVEEVIERRAFAESRNYFGQTIPWGIDSVRARDAWVGPRGTDVNVVVIDTGIDPKHPDLAAIYAGGVSMVPGNANPMDDASHGTHVAGTIAAADDGVGVVGVAPGVKLWAVKVLNADGVGNNEWITRGIDWVVTKKNELGGHWVINMSLGSKTASTAEGAIIAKAVNAGIIVVAASGNESENGIVAPVAYPAAYPNVVTVGAIGEDRGIASFSNQGPQMDLVAPGVNVLSSVPVGTTGGGWIRRADGSILPGIAVEGAPYAAINGEYVYCGNGVNPSDYPASVRGKIALVKRGPSTNTTTATHANKVRNAKQAGAIGVVIFTDERAMSAATLLAVDDPTSWTHDFQFLPTIGLPDNAAGEALAAQKTGTLSFLTEADSYDRYQGTSMSAPHVAGAAALLWSMAPSATPDQVRKALVDSASDLGPAGMDNTYGYGLLNVFEAAKLLAPELFNTPAKPSNPQPTTGRPLGRRR